MHEGLRARHYCFNPPLCFLWRKMWGCEISSTFLNLWGTGCNPSFVQVYGLHHKSCMLSRSKCSAKHLCIFGTNNPLFNHSWNATGGQYEKTVPKVKWWGCLRHFWDKIRHFWVNASQIDSWLCDNLRRLQKDWDKVREPQLIYIQTQSSRWYFWCSTIKRDNQRTPENLITSNPPCTTNSCKTLLSMIGSRNSVKIATRKWVWSQTVDHLFVSTSILKASKVKESTRVLKARQKTTRYLGNVLDTWCNQWFLKHVFNCL